MNRILKTKCKPALCAITALVAALTATAPAGAADNSFGFTVSQILSGFPPPADETFAYILKPLGRDNPMPPGSAAEGYTFGIAGNGVAEIGPLTGGRQGVYRYEIFQVIEAENPDYIYDRRKYTIEAYAALNVYVVVKNEDGTKAEAIVFENGRNEDGGTVIPPEPTKPPETITPPEPTKPPGVTTTPEPPEPAVTPGFILPPEPTNPPELILPPEPSATPGFVLPPEPTNPPELVLPPDTGGGSDNGDLDGFNSGGKEIKPGVDGPKTGDDGNTLLDIILLASGGLTAAISIIFLVIGKKREKTG